GVSTEVARDAAAVLSELDRAAFDQGAGHTPESPRSLVERTQAVVRAVDGEARRNPRTPTAHDRSRPSGRPVSGLLALVVGGMTAALLGVGSAGATASARQPSFAPAPAASVEFARGVALYHAGNFTDARHSFTSVAQRLPRASDAWANAGTAAWAAADTANAAVGWQRALRLEPGARVVRQRLALLPGEQLSGAAAVPPLSSSLLQWLALVAWGAGAALALRSVIAGGPLVTAVVSALLGTAMLGGAGAALVGERLAARDLAVVTDGAVLRSQPALAAVVRRPLATGEVVRVRARAGVWSRIQVDADAGWVERSRLRELRAD
ncbi:MAG: SH3 domain-containing protein, partial [Gemmatimonadaceae bacterium]